MTREEKNKKKQKEVQKEKTKEHASVLFRIGLFCFLTFALLFIYMRYIATKGIEVREYQIKTTKIEENFDGFKIIQFSDLELGSTFSLDDMENLVQEINLRDPDLVVFTGDLLSKQRKLKEKEQKQFIELFNEIDTNVGKYAIRGEKDQTDQVTNILTSSHFTLLDNNYDLIYYKGYQPILLIGLNQNDLKIEEAFRYTKEENSKKDLFTITLVHEPDTIDSLKGYSSDMVLAGHSKNGQINLPYFGALILPKGAKKYPNRFYQLEQTSLYVSGGLGTTGIPLRLGNRPSINFYRIQKQEVS